MKKTFLLLVGLIIGFVIAWQVASQRSLAALQRERADWEREKASLLSSQGQPTEHSSKGSTVTKTQVVQVQKELSPREIIEALQAIKISPGAAQIRNGRLAIQQLENLITIGPAALPAMREFLLRNEDIDYDLANAPKGSREGKIATEFLLPPSLRFGLFEAAKRIGGSEAEQLLTDILGSTGRGAEVAYLAYALQELAPYKYRELSVNTARELLKRPLSAVAGNLDKYDREYLYGVLSFYGDNGVAADAQSHLVADGKVDRAALNYLQQTMRTQALTSVMQAYQDPAVDPTKREPLVRYALTYAGQDAQATEFWHSAVNDPTFPMNHRRELIEDLNQDGLQNEKVPTARDAQLIATRLELIEKYYNETQDPALREAWHEAGKDLKHMGQKFLSQPESPYVLGEDVKKFNDALRAAAQGH